VLHKNLFTVFLTLIFTFGLSLMAMADVFDSHENTIVVNKIEKLFVEEKPTLGANTAIQNPDSETANPDSNSEVLEGFDWRPLGGPL